MGILMSIVLWLCIISHFMCFAYAFTFPDYAEQIDARNEPKLSPISADTRMNRNVRMALQNNQQEGEAVEYSATANACQRYQQPNSMLSNEYYDDETTNEFPWMAALGYIGVGYQIEFKCNGLIISEYFVLTVAHCVNLEYRPVVVRLGALSGRSQLFEFPIQEIIQHPYYLDRQKINDIALIRLAKQIQFTKSIRPACLETNTNDVDPTKILTEIGFERSVNRPEQLVKLNRQTMPLIQCNQTILDFNKNKHIRALRDGVRRSQYCVYDPNSTQQSCGLTSGAPLQIFPFANATLPNIIGILSFTAGNKCDNKHPEILTRIAHYTPWIEANVWPFDRRKVEIRDNANTDVASSTADMSLISAARNGHEQTVSLLIRNGANVNEVNDGETALHVAAAGGEEKIARLLIHNGADYTVKNNDGKTASEIATEKGFATLARVLQKNVAQKACDIYSNLPLITNRILGGEDASDNEFPWMAALGYLDSNLRVGFRCGGTLISEKFILTAAHCCTENNRPVTIRLGQVNLQNPEDGTIVENHLIKEITLHPEYSLTRKMNDIALIELVKPVFFSESIRPACLQTYLSDENSNTDLTVTGWGIVSSRYGNTSNTLLKANLKTIPLSECNSTVYDYANSRNWVYFRNGLDQSYYCAADPNKVSDSCKGDSGGPLQIIRRNLDLSTVVGVISTGLPCGTSWNFAGIYSRVAHFIDWIESHVWPNGEIATPLINQAALYQ